MPGSGAHDRPLLRLVSEHEPCRAAVLARELDEPRQRVAARLRRAHDRGELRRVQRGSRVFWATSRAGVRAAPPTVLEVLQDLKWHPVSEIAILTDKSEGAVRCQLYLLEDQGLVERTERARRGGGRGARTVTLWGLTEQAESDQLEAAEGSAA